MAAESLLCRKQPFHIALSAPFVHHFPCTFTPVEGEKDQNSPCCCCWWPAAAAQGEVGARSCPPPTLLHAPGHYRSLQPSCSRATPPFFLPLALQNQHITLLIKLTFKKNSINKWKKKTIPYTKIVVEVSWFDLIILCRKTKILSIFIKKLRASFWKIETSLMGDWKYLTLIINLAKFWR